MALTDARIKKAKPGFNTNKKKGEEKTDKSYKLSDGGGLYVEVMMTGAKYWRLKYHYAGKEKRLALGVYPEVTLANARLEREKARKSLEEGIDPGAIKQEAKQQRKKTQQVTSNSFQKIAEEFWTTKKPRWTPDHAKQWLVNMEKLAFPVIGDRPISEIEPREILEIMRKLEVDHKYETRNRLLRSIGAVFKYAIALNLTKYNPAEIRMALAERPKVEHFPCIGTEELPAFLRELTKYQNMTIASPIGLSALRLLMLTATRTSEVRFAKWADFDLDGRRWTIPEEQTGRKGRQGKRKSHAVPLSVQAVKILRDLYPVTGLGEYVFPNRNSTGRVISENTVLKIIEIIGYKGRMTGHGFRSLARTVLGNMGHRWEVLEAMLSHALENQTAAAYIRTTYFEERRGLMQEWADYLDKVEAGADVIPLRA